MRTNRQGKPENTSNDRQEEIRETRDRGVRLRQGSGRQEDCEGPEKRTGLWRDFQG